MISQLSYLNNEHCYVRQSSPIYFGIKNGYLDMSTMRYRFFGAVWKSINGRRYILDYWFADQENEIHSAIQSAGFLHLNTAQDAEVYEVYQYIRSVQDKENWPKRSRLGFLSTVKGIQKTRYSIWIEHVQVCENKK